MDQGQYSVLWGSKFFTEIIKYKIQSQLGNGMFSAPHILTGGPINRILIVVLITEKESNTCFL